MNIYYLLFHMSLLSLLYKFKKIELLCIYIFKIFIHIAKFPFKKITSVKLYSIT